MDGRGHPGGTVRLLEDTDTDGRPDKNTLFADGLRFPTSVCPVRDGILVSAPPDIVFLADRDGDGRAEVREVWFTGFLPGVTDSNFNGLRWHMDGRVHGVNGGNGGLVVRPDHPVAPVRLGELDFAFDPRTREFATTWPTGGGFGLVFDNAGRSFVTHNINHLQMRVLTRRVLDEIPGGSDLEGTLNISVHGANMRIHPVQEARTRPNHPEQAGWFSSAGGMGHLDHPGWPAAMARSLFVCDAASGIVHREILAPDGPILKCAVAPDESDREFLAGRDPAFRPVGLELGPDGALYLLDMQREVIEHPDYIPPRMKARADLRAGSDRGRIWRITPRAGLPPPDPLPARADTASRVRLLGSPNQWTRLAAQRLLVEQPDAAAVPLLRAALREASGPAALHALHTLRLAGKLEPDDFAAACASSLPFVRAAAMDIAAGGGFRPSPETIEALARDPDIQAAWQFLLAAPSLGLTDALRRRAALDAIRRHPADRWMLAAALRLLGRDTALAADLVKPGAGFPPAALHAIAAAQSAAPPLESLLLATAAMDAAALTAASEGGAVAVRAHRLSLTLSAAWFDAADLRRLAAALRLHEAGAPLPEGVQPEAIADALVKRAAAAGADHETRARCLRLLGHFPAGRTADALFAALRPGEAPIVREAALAALKARSEAVIAERLVREWHTLEPALRPSLAALMVDRRDFREPLARAIADGTIRTGEILLDLEQRRTLLRHSGSAIRRLLAPFLNDDDYGNRAAIVDQWLDRLPASGDPQRGRTAFQKLCFQCHRAGEIGHAVGPDLAAQGHRSVEDLLTHILDPDAAINPNYAAVTVETGDGSRHTGILVSSTGATVVLRQAMGATVSLPRADVRSITGTERSFMPAGMESAFSPQEMRDLIAFLQQDP
jgi:putative membrane-bound dehydrogenase-like protein